MGAESVTSGANGSSGGVSSQTPSSAPSSAPPSQSSSPPPSSSPSSSPPPSSQPGAGAPAAQPAFSVRDAFRAVDPQAAARYSDDASASQALLQAYQQAQQMAQYQPYLQSYIQNAGQFQQWQTEQQRVAAERQAAAQTAQQQWLKAPEFDPAWRNAVEVDTQTGQWKVKDGYPLDTAQKLRAALEHQRTFMDKFAFDPIGAIKPGLEQVVSELARQQIEQHLGQYQTVQQANQIVQESSSWLHYRDEQGRIPINPATQKPYLSQLGQMAAKFVLEAEQMGISTTEGQWRYAKAMTERTVLAEQYQRQAAQQGAVAQGSAAQQQFIQSAAAATAGNVAPATSTPPAGQGKSGGPNRVASVMDRMRAKGVIQ